MRGNWPKVVPVDTRQLSTMLVIEHHIKCIAKII